MLAEGGNLMAPSVPRLGKAVQQHDRWTGSGIDAMLIDSVCDNPVVCELYRHRQMFSVFSNRDPGELLSQNFGISSLRRGLRRPAPERHKHGNALAVTPILVAEKL